MSMIFCQHAYFRSRGTYGVICLLYTYDICHDITATKYIFVKLLVLLGEKTLFFYNLMVLYCIVLYCTALYCIVLYCTVLYCIVLYSTVLYCIVLHCTVLYCIVLHCTVLYCIVLYCTVLYCIVLHCTALYCIVLYCTVLYCTVLYCIVLFSTVEEKEHVHSFLTPLRLLQQSFA